MVTPKDVEVEGQEGEILHEAGSSESDPSPPPSGTPGGPQAGSGGGDGDAGADGDDANKRTDGHRDGPPPPPPTPVGEGPPFAPTPPPPPPPGPPPPAVPRRHRVRRIVGGVFVLLLIAFVVSAAVVPLPWYAFRPGSVRDTEPLVSVEGDTPTYRSEGSIGYTTVSLRQTTLFGLIQGWYDDDVDIHPEDEVLGDRSSDENRSFNLQLMDNSKNVATQVALERLGYRVRVTSSGSTVLRVEPGSPAEGKLDVGDTIVAVGGDRINDPEDLPNLMGDDAPGDRVTVTVESLDGDDRRDVTMTLEAAPDDPERGVMGVLVQPRDLQYDFPVDVEIDTGDVGGPSAGLAFTLAILDDLTAGELTGGERVAVTGEILDDGTVGPIGGTAQKAAAVRHEGIDTFLVPRADYEDALTRAGDVNVVPIDDLDDALNALADLGGNADDLPQVGAEEANGRR
jgi:Lon-like protease